MDVNAGRQGRRAEGPQPASGLPELVARGSIDSHWDESPSPWRTRSQTFVSRELEVALDSRPRGGAACSSRAPFGQTRTPRDWTRLSCWNARRPARRSQAVWCPTLCECGMLQPMSQPSPSRDSGSRRLPVAAEDRMSVVLTSEPGGNLEWLARLLAAEGLDARLFTVSETRIAGVRRFQDSVNTVRIAVGASSAAHTRTAVLVCWNLRLAMMASLLGSICASKRVPVVALNVIVFPKSGVGGFLRDYLYRALCRRAPLWATVNSEWLRQSCLNAYDFSPEHIGVLNDCWLPKWRGDFAEPTNLDGGYVFSGGTAARDWRTVVEVARACPTIPFRVIARRADWPGDLDVPGNLEVAFDTPLDYFWESARNARISLVSLASNVTSGLVVLILTSLMGRPVVCTRTPATELYYPAECSEMLIELGDHGGMARCVESLWVASERRLNAARAVQNYIMTTHSPESYARRLAGIIRSTTV